MSNTIKKTNRKNKTNQVVNWLNNFFTIKDLHAANPSFIEITLRSRIDHAIKDNTIAKIGSIHNGKGRPKLIFAMTPVTKEMLEEARQYGVIFDPPYDNIAVVNVDAIKLPTEEEAELAAKDHDHMEDMDHDNINA